MTPLENATKTAGCGGQRLCSFPVVEQCNGCERMREFDGEQFCSSYPAPARKWAVGRCNFATHAKAQANAAAKVNPLKASKRAAKGR